MTNKYTKRTEGFTLVELSIVIIIIGFLIAGISAGSSLIKQARLNSVVTDFQEYQIAYNSFINRYQLPPGDLDKAYAYWGSSCGVTEAACNGNGDGAIDATGANTDEVASAWKHLQLAGLVNSNIAVIPSTPNALIPGENTPSSKITEAGYALGSNYISRDGINTIAVFVNHAFAGYQFNTVNFIYLGKPDQVISTKSLINSVLIPQDVFNLDSKIDDGTIDSAGNFIGAVSGKLRTMNGIDYWGSGCLTAIFSTTAYYEINHTAAECLLVMSLNN